MPGSRGTPLLIQGLLLRLHVALFTLAPCCLELFGCCCRRLSQHGVGEVLIPLRHCWRDAFFWTFVLGVDYFVTIGRRTAQFFFGLAMINATYVSCSQAP